MSSEVGRRKGSFGVRGFARDGKPGRIEGVYPTRERAEEAAVEFERANPHAHRSRQTGTFGMRYAVEDLLRPRPIPRFRGDAWFGGTDAENDERSWA